MNKIKHLLIIILMGLIYSGRYLSFSGGPPLGNTGGVEILPVPRQLVMLVQLTAGLENLIWRGSHCSTRQDKSTTSQLF